MCKRYFQSNMYLLIYHKKQLKRKMMPEAKGVRPWNILLVIHKKKDRVLLSAIFLKVAIFPEEDIKFYPANLFS